METCKKEFKQIWKDEYLKKKCVFVENWGRGTLNIINQCKENSLPGPSFGFEWTSVKTIFYEASQKTTQEKIVKLLKSNPKYTKQDLMKIPKKGDGIIKGHLANLKKMAK